MRLKHSLRMSGVQFKTLRDHLYPGDGKEAVALMVCGRCVSHDCHIFTTRRVVPVPYHMCSVREVDQVLVVDRLGRRPCGRNLRTWSSYREGP